MTAPGTFTWLDVATSYRDGTQDQAHYDRNHIPDPRDFGLTAEDLRHASVALGDLRYWNLAAMIDALTVPAGKGR